VAFVTADQDTRVEDVVCCECELEAGAAKVPLAIFPQIWNPDGRVCVTPFGFPLNPFTLRDRLSAYERIPAELWFANPIPLTESFDP
jgi:hypothetical protein